MGRRGRRRGDLGARRKGERRPTGELLAELRERGLVWDDVDADGRKCLIVTDEAEDLLERHTGYRRP